MATIMDCINRIPIQLKKISEYYPEINKLMNINFKGKSIKKIVIVGSGTSYNAAYTTKGFGEEILGLNIDLIYPNIFLNYLSDELLSKDNLYIFISQTGTTKLVYQSLEKVKSRNLMHLTVTESLDSEIARLSDVKISMMSDKEEFIYRTIGYSATCGILTKLYLSLGAMNGRLSEDKVEMYQDDFCKLSKSITHIIDQSNNWYDEHHLNLKENEYFIFSGTNDLWPVAMEAEIKFMEMIPILTNTFELEELIHGPQNAFNKHTGYFILVRDNEDKEKAKNIFEFITHEVSRNCYMVANFETDDSNIFIKTESKYFNALEFITVFQVIGYRLAKDNGRNFTKGIYPQVVNYITKTI